jgi:plastocyanin
MTRTNNPRPRPFAQRLAGLAFVAVIAVSACGADSSGPTRAYELSLRTDDSSEEYAYIAEGDVDIRVGDEVTFQMRNTGSLPHDLQVVDPEGSAIATAPAVASGEVLTLTVLFEQPGFYQLNCLVDDHLTRHSMQALVEVTDPDA